MKISIGTRTLDLDLKATDVGLNTVAWRWWTRQWRCSVAWDESLLREARGSWLNRTCLMMHVLGGGFRTNWFLYWFLYWFTRVLIGWSTVAMYSDRGVLRD